MDTILHTVNPNAWPGAFVLVALIIAGVWMRVAPRWGADESKRLLDAIARLDAEFQRHLTEHRETERYDALRRELQAEASGPHRSGHDDLPDGGDAGSRSDRARRHRK